MRVVVLPRDTEDALLNDCDGTCANGDKCACLDIVERAGKAMTSMGIDVCALCARYRHTDEYIVIPREAGVPERVAEGPSQIRQHKREYYADETESAIVRVMQSVCVPKSVDTKIIRCTGSHGTLSVMNTFRALGTGDVYKDLADDTVKCARCRAPVEYIDYSPDEYDKCCVCNTLVPVSSFIPICPTCQKRVLKAADDANKVCLACKMNISRARAGTVQTIVEKGTGEQLYLCKRHYVPIPPRMVGNMTRDDILAKLRN